jgi:mono/diheme cytochrome c family protein
MKQVLRWLGAALAGVAGLGILAYAVVYVLSERVLRHTYAIPAVATAIPADSESIAEGRRLAVIHGCLGGCHGKQAEGAVMFDDPMIARFVAPNLTAAVRKYSDAELVAIVRHGVRPDGRSLFVMPSEAFVVLNDEDLGRIIAFLKSMPAVAGPGPGVSLGPLGRIGVAAGKFKLIAQRIAEAVPPPAATDQQTALGRYLARSTCAQCHGTDLRGDSNPAFTSPTLRMVAAYSPEEFARLLRTGVPLGGRDLVEMGAWARNNLSNLTDAEIAALYSYLHSMPDSAPSP